ncbi:MAG: ABC transporter substrate-binding protein [Anaerolineae bacterium]|nr:ABC transporter substrate-binding protein [Anaerolineae bacterium]
MRESKLLASVVLILLAFALALNLTEMAAAQYQPPTDRPGPAVERLYFKQFDVDRAPLELEAGAMDLYYFSLKIAAARALREKENVQLFEAPATTLSLLLNPAPAPEGQLNPFSIKEVRQAMQRLVDRDFVAREIYLGQALPMVTHLSPADFDYLTIYDLVWGLDLRYDPELARDQIRQAMTKAGAELVDGVWHYKGQPVRLKFIIRVEDERRELGDLIRAELTKAGFQVEPIYQPFAPAVQAVYSSDPAQMGWHLYTEGWGRGAPQRYDFGTINSMTAPWLGNMPGWREVGFWQYENKELDELGQRLFRGEFKDKAERDQMYREMTRLGLEESVRIWVATAMSTFPARADLQGVTEDLVAGPRGIWTLREAYVPGRDELTVGHAWVWTERTTWNPVGGLGDVYSVDIWRNLHDPPLWNHPFTGIPQPFRAAYEVETAGPDGKLAVPPDAVMWDVKRKTWRPVGEGVTATSKVTFDYSRYFQAPWHHGQPITMADVLYSVYQSFDLAYDPDKARIEIAMAATSRPYLDTFRGFRVVDDNHLEVYVDFWHFEPDYIASYASPAGLSMPWEMLYAMDVLVFEQRRAAYSDTAAARFNVPWLSLVMDRDARLVRRVLRDLQDRTTYPQEVFSLPDGRKLADAKAAAARYGAALDWFDRYGHLVISNGPFILARYDPPAQFAELHAFRDPAYPFKPGDHYKGRPQPIEFVDTEVGSLVPGEPFEAKVSLRGPGTLALRYLLVDAATREVVAQGEAEPVTAGEFAMRLDAGATARLEVGLYQLLLAAYSDQLAQMAERQVELEVGLPAPATPTAVPMVTPSPAATVETPAATEAPTPPPAARPGVPMGLILGLVAAIAIVGAGLALWWSRRRRQRKD